MLSALASVRRFVSERNALLPGVIVPAIGALALLGVLMVTIRFEDRPTQLYAWGGVLLGILFALWRGRKIHSGARGMGAE